MNRQLTKFNCHECQIPQERYIGYVNNRLQTHLFCSLKCHGKFNSKQNRKFYNCTGCNKPVSKTTSEVKNNKRIFCNQNCYFKYLKDNQKPKHSKAICGICKINSKLSVSKYCTACHTNKLINKTKKQTIKDIRTKGTHQANAYIRGLARKILEKINPNKQCKNCQYNIFVECCHIKPIKDFNETATLYEINNINNLIWLCPNCHYELDHGLLKIDAGSSGEGTVLINPVPEMEQQKASIALPAI